MTASIHFPSQDLAQPSSLAAAVPKASFRSRCVEDLSPDKVSTLDKQSTLWMIAAGVTFVAFTALAVGAFAIAGMFAPAYAPFIAIGALFCAMPVVNYVKKFLEYSESSKKEANQYRAIQSHYQHLSRQTLDQTQAELLSRGIGVPQIPGRGPEPETLTSLHPILAQARYLDDKIQKHLQTKNELTAKAKELANADPTENRQKIYELRNTALFTEDRAIETKIQAAFVNAILRKPNFNATFSDIASTAQITYQERILDNELQDSTRVHAFLKFNNRSLAPISYNDVKSMSIAQLGQRLADAMA